MAKSKRYKDPSNCDGKCSYCKLGKKCPEYTPPSWNQERGKEQDIEDNGWETEYETSLGYVD